MRRLVAASAFAFSLMMAGCKANPPGQVEHSVMRWTKHTVSVRNKSEQNPLPASAENLAAGREAFSHYCVACHGMDGQNTGVPFAERMSPPVLPVCLVPEEFSVMRRYGRQFSLSVTSRLRVA
jgi:mono/diheme cytochrome c family protein